MNILNMRTTMQDIMSQEWEKNTSKVCLVKWFHQHSP